MLLKSLILTNLNNKKIEFKNSLLLNIFNFPFKSLKNYQLEITLKVIC